MFKSGQSLLAPVGRGDKSAPERSGEGGFSPAIAGCPPRACYDEDVRTERRRRPTPAATYGGESETDALDKLLMSSRRYGICGSRIYSFSASKSDAAADFLGWDSD